MIVALGITAEKRLINLPTQGAAFRFHALSGRGRGSADEGR